MSLSKYPNNYFSHFLSMLAVNYPNKRGEPEATKENISDFILLYIHIEGVEEFSRLKQEVAEILKNEDAKFFMSKTWKKPDEIDLVLQIISAKK